ncbi:MAG: UPF0262 family protein [Proteobacteria bacterium]|nr:UPF0262 family protein [Pseudomonadota bacterium]MDA1132177.1 UPF0262 family protein [Pseudomonadota bacterium]
MSDPRITEITLDERTVLRRSPDIEHERKVAIYDLLQQNRFALAGEEGGPFRIRLGIEGGQLVIDVADEAGAALRRIPLALTPFRRIIKDYFVVCETYYDAIKTDSPSKIEAIDMGRRSLHDEAAEMLQERLAPYADLDRDTARRLFTLICVLHVRG